MVLVNMYYYTAFVYLATPVFLLPGTVEMNAKQKQFTVTCSPYCALNTLHRFSCEYFEIYVCMNSHRCISTTSTTTSVNQ